MNRTRLFSIIAELALLKFGIFLILDSLFFHLISFNYAALGLAWLDPYFGHWFWGIIFIVIGLIGLHASRVF